MRLIDADALIEGYKNMGYDPTEHPEESYMEGWCKGFNAGVDHCTHHAIHAPAIESRLKGRWINHRKDRGHNIADCNQCGGTLQWLDPDERPNFCSDCGADMREEEQDEQ